MHADCLTMTLCSSVGRFSAVIQQTQITTNNKSFLNIDDGMQAILTRLHHCREQTAVVYVIGNGGSAAIASHAVIDFLNMAKIKATAMLDPAVTTCISNDYGYEHVYEKQLAQFIEKKDVLIAISSSGNSKNIINAATFAKNKGAHVITLSGFSENNRLRQIGDYNLCLNANDYGQVEIGHAFILHYFTDRLREML